jgi:hypothetical protein
MRRPVQRKQENFVMRNSIANVAMTTRTATAAAVLNDDIPPMAMEATGWANSSWPFSPNDVTPLEWWRTMPADHLGDAQHLSLRATVDKICTMHGREWLAALSGDDAACVAIAFGALPITEITLEVDLAMSALSVGALGGNAAAALLLSHILQQTRLDHPFAKELSVSWLVLNLQRALEKRHVTIGNTKLRRRRGCAGHAAALHEGDFS